MQLLTIYKISFKTHLQTYFMNVKNALRAIKEEQQDSELSLFQSF